MPRYFFHVHGVRKSVDNVGEELADDRVAWDEATIIAAELFRDIDGKFQPGQQWTLEVTDEQQQPLYFIDVSARKMK